MLPELDRIYLSKQLTQTQLLTRLNPHLAVASP